MTAETPLTVETLLRRHADGLHQHDPLPSLEQLGREGRIPHIAVVTCADPRCIPENFLHLQPCEVIVFRSPGGNAISALPGLLALDHLITLSDILVVKHTDCGATVFRDDAIRETLKQRSPKHAAEVDAMSFGNITTSLEESVREHVKYLKKSSLVRKELADRCVGFVYDLTTRALTAVD